MDSEVKERLERIERLLVSIMTAFAYEKMDKGASYFYQGTKDELTQDILELKKYWSER